MGSDPQQWFLLFCSLLSLPKRSLHLFPPLSYSYLNLPKLLAAAAQAGEICADSDAYELMRGIASLYVGADNDPSYDARHMVELLIAGLRE